MSSTPVTAPDCAPLFDSHSHLGSESFAGDVGCVVERMKEVGLVGSVTVACEENEYAGLLELLAKYPGYLYGAWGLHPEYEDKPEVTVEQIVEYCRPANIVAVGETGLDYHWCSGDLTWQKKRFERHIEAAKILGKPIIVHARKAESDALDILESCNAAETGFVMHCFGGTVEEAKRTIDIGGLVSFTGVLTFKNAGTLLDVARALPLDRIMVETDCPYMAPVPKRGKRCEPAFVAYIAMKLAELHGKTAKEVAERTTRNALEFFKIV